MKINTEGQAYHFIQELKDTSPPAQKNILKETLESLELAQMYYEQKENEKGIKRTEKCIEIITNRIKELV